MSLFLSVIQFVIIGICISSSKHQYNRSRGKRWCIILRIISSPHLSTLDFGDGFGGFIFVDKNEFSLTVSTAWPLSIRPTVLLEIPVASATVSSSWPINDEQGKL